MGDMFARIRNAQQKINQCISTASKFKKFVLMQWRGKVLLQAMNSKTKTAHLKN